MVMACLQEGEEREWKEKESVRTYSKWTIRVAIERPDQACAVPQRPYQEKLYLAHGLVRQIPLRHSMPFQGKQKPVRHARSHIHIHDPA